jgi:hypothetical protein
MSEHECKMMDKIEQIGNDVTQIKKALLGDTYNPMGIVQRLIAYEAEKKVMEKRIADLEKARDNDYIKLQDLEDFKRKTSRTITLVTGGSIVAFFILQTIIKFI